MSLRISFRLKTVLGIAAIEAGLLALLVFTSVNFLQRSNEDQLIQRAQTVAQLFATTTKDAVLSTDLSSLETFVAEILKNSGVVYPRVLSTQHGTLVEGGDSQALAREFHADNNIADINDGVFDTFATVQAARKLCGRIEIGLSTDLIEQLLLSARKRIVGIALVEIVLVAIFSLALGVYLTRQLKVLCDTAEAVAGGDLGTTVRVYSNDEVGEVASAFNTMMARLQTSDAARARHESDLKQLNQQLEDRVQRRTETLRNADESLKQTQAQLLQSEKMTSLGQLSAGIAHEINNPIAFVSSNLSTLAQCSSDLLGALRRYQQAGANTADSSDIESTPPVQNEDVDLEFIAEDLPVLIRESIDGVERVRKIVLDLRNFSHSGQSEWQEADLHDGIDATLNIAKHQLKNKIELVLNYGQLPPIECISSEINQVIMNLVVNAAHAINGEGTLSISTGVDKELVFIAVTDTGCGIAPEVVKKIFDPFFTTKPVRTGLGLSLSFGIVQRHGGQIDVASTLGEGTTITLRLPVRQADRKDAPPQAEQLVSKSTPKSLAGINEVAA
jgi:two-component system NtrC family sensor kinase